nr:protein PIN-LIKES 3-like isoform X1 [Ipomoea batatas]
MRDALSLRSSVSSILQKLRKAWRFCLNFVDAFELWPFTLDEFVQGGFRHEPPQKPSAMMRLRQNVKTWADRINLKMMFSPSTIATIVGIVIGVVSFLRKLIIVDNAPLLVLDSSTDMLGYI